MTDSSWQPIETAPHDPDRKLDLWVLETWFLDGGPIIREQVGRRITDAWWDERKGWMHAQPYGGEGYSVQYADEEVEWPPTPGSNAERIVSHWRDVSPPPEA